MGGRQSLALGKNFFPVVLVVALGHLALNLPGRSTFHLLYRAVGSPELPISEDGL